MLVGVSVQIRPLLGETDDVRLTVPVKPFCAATVIVEVPVEPARTVIVVGSAGLGWGGSGLTGPPGLVVKPLPVSVTVTPQGAGEEGVASKGENTLVAATL